MRTIRFPRIRRGGEKQISASGNKVSEKQAELLPAGYEAEQHEAMQRADERCEDEYHEETEVCSHQQCPLREFCLERLFEKLKSNQEKRD